MRVAGNPLTSAGRRMIATWRARHPIWLGIARWPIGMLERLTSSSRPLVGLMEMMPQNAAGTRTLPPMSVPMPSGEPRCNDGTFASARATRATLR
jgi:hypothetical protein